MISPYTLDYLVAQMCCPCCGHVSPADFTTEMQTRLREAPQLADIGVGDELPTCPVRAAACGYIVLRESGPGEGAVLLHTWGSPACGTPFQWAAVVVRDGKIASIEPTQLTRQAIERANYIEVDARAVAAEFISTTQGFDLEDKTVVDTLRRCLPDEPSAENPLATFVGQ